MTSTNLPGKLVIGLTGNIATGKSVVRRMFEHLGAYTIDADALAHRTYSKGAPGYQKVIDRFGKWLVNKDGEIDRKKLGAVVFNDADAMRELEAIVHPLVRQATEILIRRSSQQVVVVEAIKLLESDLRTMCASIWVTNAPVEVQIERLIRKRNMTREQALERVNMQAPQAAKVLQANVVITNNGSYDDLWRQVSTAWRDIVPTGADLAETDTFKRPAAAVGELNTRRGKPKNSSAIADFITRASRGKRRITSDNVMEDFGDKAYMLLYQDGKLVGLASWQVENLVTSTTDIFLDESLDQEKALEVLIRAVEQASAELQSEALLVFTTSEIMAFEDLWKRMGYEQQSADTLGVQAWRDAASESLFIGSRLLFRQLRQERVLRPI